MSDDPDSKVLRFLRALEACHASLSRRLDTLGLWIERVVRRLDPMIGHAS